MLTKSDRADAYCSLSLLAGLTSAVLLVRDAVLTTSINNTLTTDDSDDEGT